MVRYLVYSLQDNAIETKNIEGGGGGGGAHANYDPEPVLALDGPAKRDLSPSRILFGNFGNWLIPMKIFKPKKADISARSVENCWSPFF